MADYLDSVMPIIMSRTGLTEDDVDVIQAAFDTAGDRILARRYPFNDSITEVPERYLTTQIEIAVYLLNKQGAEGETAHGENGINRTYESAYVPDSMLAGVTPIGKVFGL